MKKKQIEEKKEEKYRITINSQHWDFNNYEEARAKAKQILDTGLWWIYLQTI
jgi:hypothetical protein